MNHYPQRTCSVGEPCLVFVQTQQQQSVCNYSQDGSTKLVAVKSSSAVLCCMLIQPSVKIWGWKDTLHSSVSVLGDEPNLWWLGLIAHSSWNLCCPGKQGSGSSWEQTGVRGCKIQSAVGQHRQWGRGTSGLDKQVTRVSRHSVLPEQSSKAAGAGCLQVEAAPALCKIKV